MAKPLVIIGNIDITDYVEELKLTSNGLNADGSGRDVQDGTMKRVKIASKWQAEVKMLRISEDIMNRLALVLGLKSYEATAGVASGTFYTDTIPFGSVRWNKDDGKTYYDGVAFTMTEM